jgi:hypothetical protein
MATPQMLGQIDRLSERAEVIVMSSPALQRSDALMLASHAIGLHSGGHARADAAKGLQETVASLSMVGASHPGGRIQARDLPANRWNSATGRKCR